MHYMIYERPLNWIALAEIDMCVVSYLKGWLVEGSVVFGLVAQLNKKLVWGAKLTPVPFPHSPPAFSTTVDLRLTVRWSPKFKEIDVNHRHHSLLELMYRNCTLEKCYLIHQFRASFGQKSPEIWPSTWWSSGNYRITLKRIMNTQKNASSLHVSSIESKDQCTPARVFVDLQVALQTHFYGHG